MRWGYVALAFSTLSKNYSAALRPFTSVLQSHPSNYFTLSLSLGCCIRSAVGVLVCSFSFRVFQRRRRSSPAMSQFGAGVCDSGPLGRCLSFFGRAGASCGRPGVFGCAWIGLSKRIGSAAPLDDDCHFWAFGEWCSAWLASGTHRRLRCFPRHARVLCSTVSRCSSSRRGIGMRDECTGCPTINDRKWVEVVAAWHVCN